VTARFLVNDNGAVVGIEGVTRDISERKAFEKELSEIVTRQEQRTGQELHDGLGQDLVGSRLLAVGLQQALENRGLSEADQAADLVAALRAAEASVRSLIKGVRPVEVDANGLMAALEDLAESTHQLSHKPCMFQCEQPVPVEDSHTATQLFHIAREAVHNAVKHAAAAQITIGLEAVDDQLRMWVDDNGCGLPDNDANPPSGMGMRILQHRAGVIGAELTIESAGRKGTRVSCVLTREPLP
jgi:signal transduction histidine kinase